MKYKIFGKVNNGKFTPDNVDNFKEVFLHFNNKEVELSVGEAKKTRTMPQNKYYWGVIVRTIANYLGYSDDEMHQIFKMMFLKEYEQINKDDKTTVLPLVKSTTQLPTKEFEDYLEKIRRWSASELGLYVPEPNEVEAE